MHKAPVVEYSADTQAFIKCKIWKKKITKNE